MLQKFLLHYIKLHFSGVLLRHIPMSIVVQRLSNQRHLCFRYVQTFRVDPS